MPSPKSDPASEAAKPNPLPPLSMKLTADLVATYKAAVAELDEVKKQLKPLNDRADALYVHIFALMKKCKKSVRTLGDHHLKIDQKKNSVQWKSELAKRISAKELGQIEAAAGTQDTLVIS